MVDVYKYKGYTLVFKNNYCVLMNDTTHTQETIYNKNLKQIKKIIDLVELIEK